MSMEYADKRVAEALKLAGGNQAKARQQIINLALEDEKLLQALTRHHLKGIVAYHVERVASGRAEKKPLAPTPTPKKATGKSEDAFGMEILKAIANSSSAVFGLEGYSSPPKRGQASQRHVNALKQMASKSKTPPKKK